MALDSFEPTDLVDASNDEGKYMFSFQDVYLTYRIFSGRIHLYKGYFEDF